MNFTTFKPPCEIQSQFMGSEQKHILEKFKGNLRKKKQYFELKI
jgi:hypothetical protein